MTFVHNDNVVTCDVCPLDWLALHLKFGSVYI